MKITVKSNSVDMNCHITCYRLQSVMGKTMCSKNRKNLLAIFQKNFPKLNLCCDKIKRLIIARTHNNRFGNRLADGSAIGYNSLSAIVPADEYKSAFNCYLHL